MISLLTRAKELSRRFRGIKATKYLFPEEYANLKPNLILNDDALQEIDVRSVELLNEHYFPCYDPNYDYITKTRERPYPGISKISIVPMGFNSYDYYYQDWGGSWYFVQMESNACFDYYGYDYNALSLFEQEVATFVDYHPIQILPEVIRYVWAMTGNIWLDSHDEGDNEFDLIETEILYLEREYQEALAMMERLLFFENWFFDNYAVARRLINVIMEKVARR